MQANPKPLIPREAFYFFPRDEQFLITSKERIRIIFGGKIQLTDDEKLKIAQFKESVKTKPESASLQDQMYD